MVCSISSIDGMVVVIAFLRCFGESATASKTSAVPSAVNVDFVGMSLYFFVVDFVRAAFRLAEDAQLSIEELKSYDMLLLYSPWDVKAICEKMPVEELPTIAIFGEGALRLAIERNIPVMVSAPSPEAPSLAKAVDIYISQIRKGKEVTPIELADNDHHKEEFIRTQQNKLAKKSRVHAHK